MEDICHGDKFWDSDLTWNNNSWPQLTECFEDTALAWVPLGYLLVVAPLYVLYLASGNSCSNSCCITRLFIAKQVLTVVMVSVLVIELGVTAHEASFFNHRILSQTSWIVIMVFHILLVNLERRKHLSRFHVLFAFWLFGSIILLWRMYSAIQRETYNTEPFHFSMLTCRYLLSVGLFIVHCFSSHYRQKDKGVVCPYTAASLPSIFLLLWMDPLVIQGFKKPLQLDDLHNLVPDDEASNVLTNFLGIWDKEKKFRKRRRKSVKVPVDDLDPSGIPLQNPTQEDNRAGKDQEDDSPYEQRSFFMALIKSALCSLVSSQVGQLARVAEDVFNPFLLGFFIDYIQNQELTWHGFIYTGIILILKTLTIALAYPSGYLISLVAIRLQTTIMGAVLRKSLTVSPESRRKFKTGEIINLMSVDANNVLMMFNYIFWVWMAIVYLVVGIILTINIVGLAFLPGLGCILLIFVMNLFILHKLRIYQNATMKIKDERVKIMNEILNGIKVIKLYGWEETFMKKIKTIREKELKILLKMSILNAIFNFAWRGALFWMNFFILVTYVLTDDSHHLDAKTAFMTLSFVNLVRLAVNILPIIGADYIKGTTSLRRLNKFMNSQDISASNLERDASDSMSVRVVNGDFAWTKHDSAILKSIDLEVEPGKLIAVVGTVGAGKSSLLSAILGEMHRIKGHVNLNSSVAYVPQQAWIQNATVKENILFGSPFNPTLYYDVIKNCSLESDFKIMPAGDRTEIGEKGINLSGGQKQRISLARALYSQANIYLLDDPLSAVDAHVGKHIFEHAIGPNGCLRGKTRILVTHGVQWLPNVDQIVVMDNGQIREFGTMDELLAKNGDFARFLTQYFVQHGNLDDEKVEDIDTDITLKRDIFQRLISVASDSDGDSIRQMPCTPQGKQRLTSLSSHEVSSCLDLSSSLLGHYDLRQSIASRLEVSHEMEGTANAKKTGKDGDNRLTTDEEAAGGRVSSKLYWHLWKGLGLGYAAVIFIFTIVYHVIFHYGNYWITQWNDDNALSNFTHLPADSTARMDRNAHFIIVFTIIGLVMTFSVLVYSFLLLIRHVTACRNLHEKLLNCVMRAPMSFFDTTPVGRILNRFSQDIQIIDNDLCIVLCDVIDCFLKGLGILITISVTVPWFLTVVLPVLLVILGIQRLFVVNSCQAHRLASNRRSPIYSHFSETLSGASVIRAYRAQSQFIDESNFRINACQRAACAAAGFQRWMYSRLDMVSFLVVGSVSIFAIMLRDDLSSGIIGLTISYAFEMSIIFCLGFEFFGMLETHIVSLERVREYSVIPSEAPWTAPGDPLSLNTASPNQWPCVGSIEFCHYSTRYREGLDLVLSDISCTVNGGEKVGIVGRTGAGKSSMVLSLFRLIEAVSGKILIDGVDISQIGLHTLRHHITILPQDPVLFAGTLRMNLDPQDDKTDGEIWSALEHSHLKTFVLGLTGKLNHNVGEGGENLSLGQRQLLCLARTLLRKTKILILDEATASVDMDTDELIQKTIRTEFENCTVFTIAHRLNTVIDYDRIMVLEKGKISEFDSPTSLLSNSDSAFYSMAKEAGLVSKEAGLEAKEVELEVEDS